MEKTRNTIQRSLVLKAVRDLGSHASAEEVYKHVLKQHSSISKATVYRNLNQLTNENKVLKIASVFDVEHFDHNINSHYHFSCVSCRKVFDVDMNYISDIYDKVIDKRGFIFQSHNIVFSGLCPECFKIPNSL